MENECINVETIINYIKKLIHEKFDFLDIFIAGEECNYFFGRDGVLCPRELTYLSYMLEEYYNIKFSVEDYDDHKFYCISGLAEIIAQKVLDNCE